MPGQLQLGTKFSTQKILSNNTCNCCWPESCTSLEQIVFKVYCTQCFLFIEYAGSEFLPQHLSWVPSLGQDYVALCENEGTFSHAVMMGGYYGCFLEAAGRTPEEVQIWTLHFVNSVLIAIDQNDYWLFWGCIFLKCGSVWSLSLIGLEIDKSLCTSTVPSLEVVDVPKNMTAEGYKALQSYLSG